MMLFIHIDFQFHSSISKRNSHAFSLPGVAALCFAFPVSYFPLSSYSSPRLFAVATTRSINSSRSSASTNPFAMALSVLSSTRLR